jgi:plastocyanin
MKDLITALALPLLLATGALRAGEQTIAINGYRFLPPALTVPAGTTVTWVNHDEEPHRVVGKDKAFRSPALDTDERYSVTFAQPGTYRYYCSIHSKMTGTVTVLDER